MNGRLQLTLAAGVFAAGLGLGTITAGPSPPSAAGMSSLTLRDDPVEGGNENRRRAEKRRPQAGERKGLKSFERAAGQGKGDDDSDDRRTPRRRNLGGDEGSDDDSSLPAAGDAVAPGSVDDDDGWGDDDGGDDDGGDDDGGDDDGGDDDGGDD